HLERDAAGAIQAYAAQWNDDLHHLLHVLTTGETGGYYADHAGAARARLGRTLAAGFHYQGEHSAPPGRRSRQPRAPSPPTALVAFLQNHEQIGTGAMGERIGSLAPAEALRAAATIVLLSPSIPLLFMGEEWNAPQPFVFFCDVGPELADAVREGRRREVAHFPEFADDAAPPR